MPKEYPITAPIPPHVAAEAGPNKTHAPNAEAVKLDVNEKIFSIHYDTNKFLTIINLTSSFRPEVK